MKLLAIRLGCQETSAKSLVITTNGLIALGAGEEQFTVRKQMVEMVLSSTGGN